MNLIPNAELFFLAGGRAKTLVKKSTAELFEGRSVLLVSINGAFTPTDEKMVKDYEKLYLHFKDTTIIGNPNDATHIDDIYFLCMNDAYVMDAWWKKMKIKNCKVPSTDPCGKPKTIFTRSDNVPPTLIGGYLCNKRMYTQKAFILFFAVSKYIFILC